MTSQVPLERFLAGDKGEATSKLLRHEVPRLTEFVLVGLGDEVLGDKLAG